MEFKLPRMCYGPMCLKVLHEFVEYHKIDKDIPLPDGKEYPHISFEKIFNVMIHSMSEEKREAIIKDAIAYYNDLPPSVR